MWSVAACCTAAWCCCTALSCCCGAARGLGCGDLTLPLALELDTNIGVDREGDMFAGVPDTLGARKGDLGTRRGEDRLAWWCFKEEGTTRSLTASAVRLAGGEVVPLPRPCWPWGPQLLLALESLDCPSLEANRTTPGTDALEAEECTADGTAVDASCGVACPVPRLDPDVERTACISDKRCARDRVSFLTSSSWPWTISRRWELARLCSLLSAAKVSWACWWNSAKNALIGWKSFPSRDTSGCPSALRDTTAVTMEPNR